MDRLQQTRLEHGGSQALVEFFNALTINTYYVSGALLGTFQRSCHLIYTYLILFNNSFIKQKVSIFQLQLTYNIILISGVQHSD